MGPIPDEDRRFLDGTIESVDQLEVLRVLGEQPAREWTAPDLAAAAQIDPPAAAAHALALHARGLLTAEKRGADVACRYGPRTPDLEARVGRLLALYRERPVTLIKLVYERARDPLRAFSDAFRLRPDGG